MGLGQNLTRTKLSVGDGQDDLSQTCDLHVIDEEHNARLEEQVRKWYTAIRIAPKVDERPRAIVEVCDRIQYVACSNCCQ